MNAELHSTNVASVELCQQYMTVKILFKNKVSGFTHAIKAESENCILNLSFGHVQCLFTCCHFAICFKLTVFIKIRISAIYCEKQGLYFSSIVYLLSVSQIMCVFQKLCHGLDLSCVGYEIEQCLEIIHIY